MKQLKGKENSLYPSRLRGRGAEVSKTLFYLKIKLRKIYSNAAIRSITLSAMVTHLIEAL